MFPSWLVRFQPFTPFRTAVFQQRPQGASGKTAIRSIEPLTEGLVDLRDAPAGVQDGLAVFLARRQLGGLWRELVSSRRRRSRSGSGEGTGLAPGCQPSFSIQTFSESVL